MSTTTEKVTYVQATTDWPYDEIKADYYAGANVWREVDVKFANYCLEVLPPMDWRRGTFLVSEPFSHTDDGDAIHCCITEISGRHFARYVPRRQASAMVSELAKIVFG